MMFSPLAEEREATRDFHVLWGISVQESTRKKQDWGFERSWMQPQNIVASCQAQPAWGRSAGKGTLWLRAQQSWNIPQGPVSALGRLGWGSRACQGWGPGDSVHRGCTSAGRQLPLSPPRARLVRRGLGAQRAKTPKPGSTRGGAGDHQARDARQGTPGREH